MTIAYTYTASVPLEVSKYLVFDFRLKRVTLYGIPYIMRVSCGKVKAFIIVITQKTRVKWEKTRSLVYKHNVMSTTASAVPQIENTHGSAHHACFTTIKFVISIDN